MKKKIYKVVSKGIIALLFGWATPFFAQGLVNLSPEWFGPNANPVPEFTDATIPESTQVRVDGDYYFGHGDKTETLYFRAEVPLVKKKISLKTWFSAEHFQVSDAVKQSRKMRDQKGGSVGDLYFQTRVRLWDEAQYTPAIILNATLKTSTGENFFNRRYFNTAGYYFDVEFGKSVPINLFFTDLRLVGDLGFFSWDVLTPNKNVQDDAPMYGFKMILKKKNFTWENTVSGYKGWLRRTPNYGNNPLVVSTRFGVQSKTALYFMQYQHGIKSFPYEQIRLGAQFSLPTWTPHF